MTQKTSSGISILIPSWNGWHLLRQNLPSVQAAARYFASHTGNQVQILVVDDGSRDETAQLLPKQFPDVEVVARPHNEGFAAACNTGFSHGRFPLVALLNNDVRVCQDYLVYQAEHFHDPDVFAVTAKVFEWDSTIFAAGGRVGRFRRGFWSVYLNYDVSRAEAGDWIAPRRLLSAYAVGGFSTYALDKVKLLGGFNTLLSPFHWEDIDLSYRGWKRGWEIRYEPRSRAFHRASSTIDAYFPPKSVQAIALRNRLLFHWINLHSGSFFLRHLSMLPLLLLSRILVLDPSFYRSFLEALRQLGQVRRLRRMERENARRSDAEIARLLKAFYESAPVDIYYNHQDVLARHPEAQPRN